jgi:anti-sigma28 factor (negative regulator of flagellin synthesis)
MKQDDSRSSKSGRPDKMHTSSGDGSTDYGENVVKSREIDDLLYAIECLPEVREAKIRDIKLRIDAGLYLIDTVKIAEKMLQEW